MNFRQGGVIAAGMVLIAASVACEALSTTSEPATGAPAVATAAIQAAPADTAEPAAAAEATATTDPCIPWDQVTARMKGQVVCMRGLITEFSTPGRAGTRYSFSDKSGSFFLYSAKYEIINPNTGKTIAAGTCVEVTGPIDVESDTPFINLDKIIESTGDTVEGFSFYDDASFCQELLPYSETRPRGPPKPRPNCLGFSVILLLWDPWGPVSTIQARGNAVPSKGRILHVEDNADNRHLVRRVLEAEGYEVVEAQNGAQAIEYLNSQHIDLALMDINMPDIDGYTLATRIRATPRFANMPILAMTANVMRGDRERSLQAGCDGYIQKPIDIDTLSMQLERYLRKHGRY